MGKILDQSMTHEVRLRKAVLTLFAVMKIGRESVIRMAVVLAL